MKNEFDVSVEYQKGRDVTNENKYLWIGIAIMTVAAFLDWELFEWFYRFLSKPN